MFVNLNDYHKVITSDHKETPDSDTIIEQSGEYVMSKLSSFRTAREIAEDTWLEAWSLYMGTPNAVDHQRTQTLNTVGLVNNDWRHRLNTGKSFQVIETVHAYLMSALFPNKQWFDVEPKNPGYAADARIIRKYVANKFVEGKFYTQFEKYLRQLLVCGVSVMALPWRYETIPYNVNITQKLTSSYDTIEPSTKVVVTKVVRNHPEFECLDIFDCYVDPMAKLPNEADFIRRIRKTRSDVIHCVRQGYYENIKDLTVVNLPPIPGNDNYKRERLTEFQGVQTEKSYSMSDVVEVIEFWGDVHIDGVSLIDVCVTCIGGTVVRMEPNRFWSGKPFVVGSVTELPETPYSIGILQPNLGLMHQLNIITNQRLDCLEIHANNMFTLKDNSTLQPEDISVEPGKVYSVEEHGDLQPINMGNAPFTVGYQEAAILEQNIDSNTGTGNLISANSARTGERVTASEIQAVKDAGGNRLSNVMRHIEDTSLFEILSRVFRGTQQFVKQSEVVRMSGVKKGAATYHEVTPESINNEYRLFPIGADFVTERTKYVRQRMELISFVSQVPEMNARINYETVLNDVINHMGFDDPESYLKPLQQPEQPADMSPEQVTQEAMSNEQQTPEDLAYHLGGNSLKRVAQANITADGGADYLNRTTGVDINA
jgi:hypothetical protein